MSKAIENKISQSEKVEKIKLASFKMIKQSFSDKDFREKLLLTRTTINSKSTVTALQDSVLAIAASQASKASMLALANYTVNVLHIKDCMHKSDTTKDVLHSTTSRFRKHIKATLKVYERTISFYDYDEKKDCVIFTQKYIDLCTKDTEYRKAVRACISRYQATRDISDTIEKKMLANKQAKLRKKAEAVKTEAVKTEAVKTEAVKTEAVKTEAVKKTA